MRMHTANMQRLDEKGFMLKKTL